MFLICGEALFDMFLRASQAGDTRLLLDAVPGGSPFNVALGLKRLGQPVEFFSGLARDLMGARLIAFMDREGIGRNYAVASDRPTALSVVGLDEQGGPDYAFYGDNPAYSAITETDLPTLAPEIRVIHVGSIATAIQPCGAALATLVEREAPQRLISYDPNVRPTIEPDLEVWRVAFARFSAAAHIVKVSAEDLDMLFPDRPHDEIAQQLLDNGTRLVVITGGMEGASGWTQSAKVTRAARPVVVVDTVGAGDSYQAALLAGLAEMGCLNPGAIDGLTPNALTQLLAFAGHAAGLTCGKRGADLPFRSEISNRLL